MKTKLLLVLTCLTFKIFAQEPIDPFEATRQSIFENVDRLQVTTGLLIDYGVRYADVAKFDGTIHANNYLDRNLWSMLYSSVYSMEFNANAVLITPAVMNTSIKNYEDTARVNLVALHYKYEKFKDDAIASGFMSVSSDKIYETSDPTTPYEIKHVFGMATDRNQLIGPQQTFQFRASFFVRNVVTTIGSIEADFGSGQGWQTIAFDTDIPVTYATDGDKDILLKVTYTDGLIMQAHTRVSISQAEACTNCRYSSPPGSTVFPIGTFPVPAAEMGAAHVTIATAGTDNVFDKPLIIVEGFDPDDIFNYNKLIGSSGFTGGQSLNISVDFDHEDQTLSEALEAHEFDLVFINFDNSTDDITRNAFLVENVISYVNANKQGTEKLVVMGFSMGGLVARYALRDMELRGVDHKTKLYVSIDSPHQGANVPLGYQAAIRHLTGLHLLGVNLAASSPGIQQGFDLLNSAAAKQMLYYQLSGSGESLAIDNTPHTNFMADYTSKGYPTLNGIRNIAIADGSECARPQTYGPYTQLISSDGGRDLNYATALLLSTLYSVLGFHIGLITTDAELKIDIDIRSLPDQQVQRIYYFKVYIKKTILGVIHSTTVLSEKSLNSTGDQLPIDSSPGGFSDISEFAEIPTNVDSVKINLLQSQFNFVPTFSALDISSGTQPIVSSDLTRTYSTVMALPPTKTSPFVNFFTNPDANQFHTQLTTNNGKWLMQELIGTPIVSSCSYLCPATDIFPVVSGPSLICTSGTYALTNKPADATIAWSTSTGGVTMNSSGVASVASFRGPLLVKAVVNGACGSSPEITLPVSAGSPYFSVASVNGTNADFSGSTPYPYYVSSWNTIAVTAVENGNGSNAHVNFSASSVKTINTMNPYEGIFDVFTKFNNTYILVSFNAANSCGTSYGWITLCNGPNCQGLAIVAPPSPSSIMAYPNPVSESLTIELMDSASESLDNKMIFEPYQVQLIDKNARTVYREESTESISRLPTDHLPSGIYYINIFYRDAVLRKQIVINHEK